MHLFFLTFLSIFSFFTPKEVSKDIVISIEKNTEEGYLYKVEFENNYVHEKLVFDTQTIFLKEIQFLDKNQRPLSKKLLSLHRHAYEIANTQQNTYYIFVRYHKKPFLPLRIFDTHAYYASHRISDMLDGVYIGFVVMVLLLNIFFYMSMGNKVFLYYIAFLLSINLAILCIDGYLLNFIDSSGLYKTVMLFKYLVPLTGALFATKFLDLKTKTPLIVGIGFSIITLLLYILSLTTDVFLYEALADTFAFLHLVIFWSFGIQQFKENAYAKFFVIGYSIILSASMGYIIPENFNFQSFKLSMGHLKLGAVFEMIILTYAISYRMKILQMELNKMQEQLDKYLKDLQLLESDNKIITQKLTEENNLSERESDVLLHLLSNKTYKEISEVLYISPNTVKYHIGNLYKKLNVKNKKEIKLVEAII